MKFAALAAAAAFAFAAGAALANDPTPKPAKATPAPNLVCPVTKEKIASVKAAQGSSVYKGKTYYFCCSGCKPMFDANPAKYVTAAKPTPGAKATPAPKKA